MDNVDGVRTNNAPSSLEETHAETIKTMSFIVIKRK
jgi:hypothetical protein